MEKIDTEQKNLDKSTQQTSSEQLQKVQKQQDNPIQRKSDNPIQRKSPAPRIVIGFLSPTATTMNNLDLSAIQNNFSNDEETNNEANDDNARGNPPIQESGGSGRGDDPGHTSADKLS